MEHTHKLSFSTFFRVISLIETWIVVWFPNYNLDVSVKKKKKKNILQEEYVSGDEVGRLQCEHKYHVACIQQWLRMKNWCPICKITALSPFQMI